MSADFGDGYLRAWFTERVASQRYGDDADDVDK